AKLPDDRIGALALREASKQLSSEHTRVELSAETTSLSLFLRRLRFRNLTMRVIPEGGMPQSIQWEEARLSPSVFQLLVGRFGGSLKIIQNGRATLQASFWASGSGSFSLSAELDQADLGTKGLGFTALLSDITASIPITGSINLEGAGTPSSISGNVFLSIGNTRIQNLKLGSTVLPTLNVSDGEIRLMVSGGKAKIETFRISKVEREADDIRGTITGDVTLASVFEQSSLNTEIKIKLSRPLLDSLGYLASLALGTPSPDGGFEFKLTGPLSQPERKNQAGSS
ncbi:type II secretion system protein GspN, partial [bacterium]|nr:type II secretion system protein GspN [bacterium]